MAVRENWYLTITWRKSSFSGNDADCVQVARYESSPKLSGEEPASSPERPPDHG
jgi:hypothetical protein